MRKSRIKMPALNYESLEEFISPISNSSEQKKFADNFFRNSTILKHPSNATTLPKYNLRDMYQTISIINVLDFLCVLREHNIIINAKEFAKEFLYRKYDLKPFINIAPHYFGKYWTKSIDFSENITYNTFLLTLKELFSNNKRSPKNNIKSISQHLNNYLEAMLTHPCP